MKYNFLIYVMLIVYFVSLFLIYNLLDSSKHKSYSIHQTYGPDNLYELDILGNKRKKYLSLNDNFYSFKIKDNIKLYTNKYTIYGL